MSARDQNESKPIRGAGCGVNMNRTASRAMTAALPGSTPAGQLALGATQRSLTQWTTGLAAGSFP